MAKNRRINQRPVTPGVHAVSRKPESDRLLEAHATRESFIYRHKWRSGDMLMWDNRCLLHRADPNFDAALHPRVLHRTCLRGTAPA